MAEAPLPYFFGPLLIADNFDVTVAFYKTALGLAVQGARPYAEYRSESGRFAIVDAEFWSRNNAKDRPMVRGATGAPVTELVIQVADVDEAFERLMALELKFLDAPTDRPAMGLRNAFLRDPDGRVVEITSPLPPRVR